MYATSKKPIDLDVLLSEVWAADLLGLSSRTLQAWRGKNTGPAFVRVGRAVRYRRRDLIAWMDANTVRSLAGEPDSSLTHCDETSGCAAAAYKRRPSNLSD